MTTRDRFDDVVAQWLMDNGPADIRPAAVEQALQAAAARPQRHGLRAWLGGSPVIVPRARVALIVALAALVVTATLMVAGMLLSRPSPLGGGGWINVSSATSGVHILSPDGASDRSPIGTHGRCPRLSPDGSEIGYALRFFAYQVVPLGGGVPRRVTEINNFGYREGVWSPDRSHVAFRTNESTGQALNLASPFDKVDPTHRVIYTTGDGLYSEAAWSADSKRIAVAHGRGGELTIDVIDLSGAVQQSIGPFPIQADTSDLGSFLTWSPDGARLAYIDAAGGSFTLQVINLATGARHNLGAAAIGDAYAASPWSADGKWLAVDDPDGNLLVVSADGGTRITGPALLRDIDGAWVKWSPAADVVALRAAAGLVTVRADGTNRTQLKWTAGAGNWDFAWSPDGTRIVVAADHGPLGGLEITNLDASGQTAPLLVATYPTVRDEQLCVSWDAPTNQ